MYKIELEISLDDKFIREVVTELINNLGFTPNFFEIFETPLTGLKKKNYNQDIMLRLFKQSVLPHRLFIINQVKKDTAHEEEVVITINDYLDEDFKNRYIESCSISIRVKDYKEILNNQAVIKILESEHLILAYIYNYIDVSQQSRKFAYSIEKLGFVVSKFTPRSGGGFDIDISENWGKKERFISDMLLVAAPIIWFGKSFKPISSWEVLLNYKYAHLHQNYIKYELFDIADDPQNHRELQKEFWEFMESSGVKKIIEINPGEKLSAEKDLLDMEQRHIRYMNSKDRVKITKTKGNW